MITIGGKPTGPQVNDSTDYVSWMKANNMTRRSPKTKFPKDFKLPEWGDEYTSEQKFILNEMYMDMAARDMAPDAPDTATTPASSRDNFTRSTQRVNPSAANKPTSLFTNIDQAGADSLLPTNQSRQRTNSLFTHADPTGARQAFSTWIPQEQKPLDLSYEEVSRALTNIQRKMLRETDPAKTQELTDAYNVLNNYSAATYQQGSKDRVAQMDSEAKWLTLKKTALEQQLREDSDALEALLNAGSGGATTEGTNANFEDTLSKITDPGVRAAVEKAQGTYNGNPEYFNERAMTPDTTSAYQKVGETERQLKETTDKLYQLYHSGEGYLATQNAEKGYTEIPSQPDFWSAPQASVKITKPKFTGVPWADRDNFENTEYYDYATDAEKQTVNYLAAHPDVYGEGAAAGYIENYIMPSLLQRKYAKESGDLPSGQDIGLGEGAALFAEATGTNIFGAPKAAIQAYVQKIFQPKDQYTLPLTGLNERMYDTQLAGDILSGTLGEDLNKRWGTVDTGFAGERGVGDLINLGSSAVQSLSTAALGKAGAGAVGLAGMGLTQAANGYLDSYARTGDENTALSYATATGIAEAFFEKFSLDALLDVNSGNAIFQILKNMGVEGSEEGFTALADTLADEVINGDKSLISIATDQYIANGMDPTAAREQAGKDWARDTWYQVLAGAVQGGGMATGGRVVNALTNAYGRAIYNRLNKSTNAQQTPTEAAQAPTGTAPSPGTPAAVKTAADALSGAFKASESGQTSVVDSDGARNTVTPLNIKNVGSAQPNVTVRDTAGNTFDAPISEIEFGNDIASDDYAYAAGMADDEIANAFIANVGDAAHKEDVAAGMNFVYERAQEGRRLEALQKSVIAQPLSEAQLHIAYDLGVRQRSAKIAQEQAVATERRKALPFKTGTIDYGEVDMGSLNEIQRERANLAAEIVSLSGVNVHLFESKADADGNYVSADGRLAPNGYYVPSSGEIYLDINAGRNNANVDVEQSAVLAVAAHEMTHRAKAASPELYMQFQDAAIWYMEQEGVDVDALIDNVMSGDPSVTSREIALEEIASNVAAPLLGMSDFVERLYAARPKQALTLGQKIVEFVKALKERIARAYKGVKMPKEARMAIKHLDALAKPWADMMADAARLDEPEPAEEPAQDTLSDAEIVSEMNGAGVAVFTDATELTDANTRFSVREEDPPEKTEIAYKLLRVKKSAKGRLFPLFVSANEATPLNVWLNADVGETTTTDKGQTKVRSKLGNLAFRPGWHLGDLPYETHIGKKGVGGKIAFMNADHVWAECEVAADIDYQPEANTQPTRDLKKLPTNGMYRFKTNPNMTGEWIITGAMKINRVLTDAEVRKICAENGLTPLPREGGRDIDLSAYGLAEFADAGARNSARERDSEYLSAVERGDMEAAQKMVDEAAKAAGYTLRGYHGTSQPTYRYDRVGYGDEKDYKNKRLPFTVFQAGQSGGVYIATNREVSEGFKRRFDGVPGTVMSVYTRFANPFVVNEHVFSSVPFDYNVPTPTAMKNAGYKQASVSTEEISAYAQSNGYDGVIVEGIREGGGTYTDDYIAFSSNEIKLADPVTYSDSGSVIPLSERFNPANEDIRYSVRDSGEVDSEGNAIAWSDLRDKKLSLQRQVDTAIKSDEYLRVVDIVASIKDLDSPEGRKAVREYNAIANPIAKMQNRIKQIDSEMEAMDAKAATARADAEREKVSKSGKTEADYYRAKAVKEFGYTANYSYAGYVLPNGKMLNLGGEGGMRGQDHRAVGTIYEGAEDYTGGLIRFMNEGNVRLMPESPGVDVSTVSEPTRAQYATIRAFVEARGKNEFYVDLSDVKGKNVGSYEYEGRVSPARVVADVQYFFENGETRPQSDISRFRYSQRDPEAISAREVLATALEGAAQNPREKQMLSTYKEQIGKYDKIQKDIAARRARIRELTFGKYEHTTATRDELAKLKNQVSVLWDQLSRQDKRLLTLEAAQPLKDLATREQDIAIRKVRTEMDARIAEIRRKRDEKIERTRQEGRDRVERMRQGRKDTEIRGKIKEIIDDLNTRLMKPVEGRYVPKEFTKLVVELGELVQTRRGVPTSAKTREKLAAIKNAYDALKGDPNFGSIYSDAVKGLIEHVTKLVGEKTIYQLDSDDLNELYVALSAARKMIADAVKIFGDEKNRDAIKLGIQGMEELRRSRGNFDWKKAEKYFSSLISTRSMFLRFGNQEEGGTWDTAYKILNKGEHEVERIIMEANAIFKDVIEGKANQKELARLQSTAAADLVDVGLLDRDGAPVKITRDMMLELYKHLMNSQNVAHVVYGGMKAPDMKAYYDAKEGAWGQDTLRIAGFGERFAALEERLDAAETDAERAAIREEYNDTKAAGDAYIAAVRDKIAGMLTPYEKKLLGKMKQFYDVYSPEVLNKVTMELYGFKRANVENYYHITTDPNFRNASFDTISRNFALENAGFMKDRVNAANPILLGGIIETTRDHITKMAQYAGMVIPLSDFQKIYNTKLRGYAGSLQDSLVTAFDTNGKKWVENYLSDLNHARKRESTVFDVLRGKYAKGVLTFNVVSALKQVTSFPAAATVVGWKHMMHAVVQGGRSNRIISRADRGLIDKYSTMLSTASRGLTSAELGDIRQDMKWGARFNKAIDFLQKMDVATRGRMWDAARYYVDENFKGLAKGTQAQIDAGESPYYQKVAEVFDKIVEDTQQSYSVSQLPDILRSPNALIRSMTMFMTQPLKNIGAVYDAGANLRAKGIAVRQNGNEETRAALHDARVRFANTVTSQVTALMFERIMSLAGMFLLYKVNPLRDKDEEITFDSILRWFAWGTFGNILGSFVFGNELASIIESFAKKQEPYDIEVMGISSITDFVKAVYSCWNDINKMATDEDYEWPTNFREGAIKWGNGPLSRVATTAGNLLGVPVGNVLNLVKAAYFHGVDAAEGELGSFEAGLTRGNAYFYGQLYDLAAAGDRAGFDARMAEVMADRGMTESDALSGVKTAIGEAYVAGEIDEKAANALLSSYVGMREEDRAKQINEWKYKLDTGESFGKMKDLFLDGSLTASEAIAARMKYGTTDKANAEATVLQWQYEADTGREWGKMGDDMLNGDISEAEARKLLLKYDRKKPTKENPKGLIDKPDANEKINGWRYMDETGATSFSRYDYVYDAFDAGSKTTFDKEVKNMISDYEMEQGDVYEQVGSYLLKQVKEGDVTPDAAIRLREKFLGETFDDVERMEELNRYEYAVENGTVKGYSKYGKYVKSMYASAVKGNADGFKAALDKAMSDMDASEDTVYSEFRSKIKKEYVEGRINSETATKYLTEFGDKTVDEAYWVMQGWDYEPEDDEDTYSKYDELNAAVISGTGYKEATDELLAHGLDAKDVASATKSAIKKAYVDGTVDVSGATSLLKKYGMVEDENDVYWQMREWDYYKENETSEGYGKYKDFLGAMQTGSGLSTYASELLTHGVEKSSIASAITSAYKDEYLALKASNPGAAESMLDWLLDGYEAIGYERGYEYNRYIKNWK